MSTSRRWLNGLRSWSSALTLAAASSAALAAPAYAGPIDQVWVGVLAHSVTHSSRLEAGTEDYTLEIDTARPEVLRALGAPRLNIVIAANSERHSNLASLGLVWDHQLFRNLYGSADFGLGVTNGLIKPRVGPQGLSDFRTRLLLGSHVLFRGAGGLGWRFSDRWSVGVEFVHASNGGILGPHPFNRGINDAGVRVGYRFK